MDVVKKLNELLNYWILNTGFMLKESAGHVVYRDVNDVAEKTHAIQFQLDFKVTAYSTTQQFCLHSAFFALWLSEWWS